MRWPSAKSKVVSMVKAKRSLKFRVKRQITETHDEHLRLKMQKTRHLSSGKQGKLDTVWEFDCFLPKSSQISVKFDFTENLWQKNFKFNKLCQSSPE